MPPESGSRHEDARVASGDELNLLLGEFSEDVLLAALENPNLNEGHVARLLERLDLPAKVLGAVAAEGKYIQKELSRRGGAQG